MYLEELENRRLLSIALPSIPANTYNVTAYGAVADGSTNNAADIQKAIAAAAKTGGTVEFPAASQPYESGPITLASDINFQIDAGAELQALPYSFYPDAGKSSVSNFITAKSISNFEITGGGAIDGNGSAWWTAYNANNSIARPRLIEISSCSTLLVQGLTLQNSPEFHLYFDSTSTVTINGITINSPADSPNTDGIDPAGQHYLIENCSISTGDDNIAIKPEDVFCGDITITNCSFGAGHGLSVGGETNDGLNGLTVTACTFDGTTAGIRLKAERGEGGLVQNVSYSNLTMTDVEYPININSYYNIGSVPTNPQDAAQTVTSTTPIWQNITISNVTSSWDTTGGEYPNSYCGIIWGLPEEPINNITLTDVNLSARYGIDVDHVRNMSFDISSHFTAASGGSLISTTTAQTPYDATLSEFAEVTSADQTVRLVSSGSVFNFFSNGNLLATIDPALLTSFSIEASANDDTIILDFSAGNFPVPITINAASDADDDTLNLIGSSPTDPFALNASQITHASSSISFSNIPILALSTGTFALSADLAGAALQINNQASVQLTSDQHLSSLTFTGSGQLNIASQTIYLAQTGAAADAAVFAILQSSFNSNWTGPGITSALASSQFATDIGYYDDGSQIILRPAYAGDANLDGSINADDLSLVMLGQTQQKTDWFLGNFNYDSSINSDDWSLLMKGSAELQTSGALAVSAMMSQPSFAHGEPIWASTGASLLDPPADDSQWLA